MIDPVTNLLEVARYSNFSAKEAAHLFQITWLARYPKPMRCIHDSGPEFAGHDFQFPLLYANIKSKPTTSGNPQGNSVLETIHRSMGVVIRAIINEKKPTDADEALKLVDIALAAAMHATRVSSNSALDYCSPGGLVFRRDMFLDIPFATDLFTINQLRQHKIDARLVKANAQRIPHDFQVGEQILRRNDLGPSDKLKATGQGPFRIERVHTNGTVTIRIGPHVRERINIRRIQPFRSQTP
jgi:hypothetical protein